MNWKTIDRLGQNKLREYECHIIIKNQFYKRTTFEIDSINSNFQKILLDRQVLYLKF